MFNVIIKKHFANDKLSTSCLDLLENAFLSVLVPIHTETAFLVTENHER